MIKNRFGLPALTGRPGENVPCCLLGTKRRLAPTIVPLAMTACSIFLFIASSFAEVYITADEAVKNIFPGLQRYETESNIREGQEFKVHTVFKDNRVIGWAVVLDEMGKKMPITFLVGIDNQGRVLDVYLLEFRDLFGSDIKRKSFLRQFRNKTTRDNLSAGKGIDAVTGATISSRAAATAVKRALMIVEETKM